MNFFNPPSNHPPSPPNKYGSFAPPSSQQSYSQSDPDGEGKVRHSGFSENFTIEYLAFEDLPPVPEDDNLMKVFERARADFAAADWIRQFNAVTTLRMLNKSFPGRANALFEAFGESVLKALFSPKTGVVKNGLFLALEVLANAKHSGVSPSVVVRLAEILLQKSVNNSRVIRPLCDLGLQLVVANALGDETLSALCNCSIAQNKVLNERAFRFVAEALGHLRENIAAVHPDTLRTLFRCLAYALEYGSAQTKTNTRAVLAYLSGLMGPDNYMDYLKLLYQNSALQIQHVEKLAKVTQAREARQSLGEALRKSSCDPRACLPQCMIPVEINKVPY